VFGFGNFKIDKLLFLNAKSANVSPMGANYREQKIFAFYTVAGRAIGFALEQPLHVVALACSASRILK
jgi:hypothetical protein